MTPPAEYRNAELRYYLNIFLKLNFLAIPPAPVYRTEFTAPVSSKIPDGIFTF